MTRNKRTSEGGSPRINITGVPRKPIDVAGLVSVLTDLAAELAKNANQDRPTSKGTEEGGQHE